MIYFAVFVCCLFASSALAFEDKTVAQYLKDNAEFSTLYSLLNSSGLAKDLDGAGTFILKFRRINRTKRNRRRSV